MGSGKTSYFIEFINNHPDDSFIFVTPYLDEVERIKDCCSRTFYDPKPWGHSKHDDFNLLLSEGKDIATTHATFSRSDAKTMELLKDGRYTLIIDEAVEPLINYNDACGDHINNADIKLLIEQGFITIDSNRAVHWMKPDYEGSKYWRLAFCAKNNNLFYLDQSLLAWQFPPKIFELFSRVFVLTYLFKGSMLYPFFQAHGIDYTMASVYKDHSGEYCLKEYSESCEERKAISDLIHVYADDNHREMFAYKNRALSASWYRSADNKDLATLKKYMGIFLRAVNAKNDRIMWSTYKNYLKDIKGRGYTQAHTLSKEERELKGQARDRAEKKSQCYVSCNCRSTNDFSDRDILMYVINLFPNEYISRHYSTMKKPDGSEIDFNRDLWTLSNFLQWVFRSAIRNGKPITIYLPSVRMRTILNLWLHPECE